MLIVEYQTDGERLKVALEHAPEMVVVPEEWYLADETAHYLFWAEGGEFSAFEAGLEADPTVTNQRILTDLETRRLYRVTTTEHGHETALPIWRDLDLVLLEGERTLEGWTLRIRFPDRETLAEYQRLHQEREYPFRLQRIYYESEAQGDIEPSLTAAQKEALVAAFEAGHFDVPQQASQAEVAAQMDISPQALSERLQRGIRTLINEIVVDS